MFVRDLMTPEPITVTPNASLAEALDIMHINGIHELPVLDGTRLAGIITDRDVRSLLGPQTEDADQVSLDQAVETVMTEDVSVLTPDGTLAEACRLIAELRVGAMPVVNHNLTLVGILSVTDLLAAAADRFEV